MKNNSLNLDMSSLGYCGGAGMWWPTAVGKLGGWVGVGVQVCVSVPVLILGAWAAGHLNVF